MAGKLSGSAIQTGTITSTQLSSELGPVSSELQLVGSGVSLNVSNNAVFSGNVGIGTTASSGVVTIAGSGWMHIFSNADNNPPSATDPFGLWFSSNYNAGSTEGNIAYRNFLTFASWDGSTYNERVRIDANGNVSVGTTSSSFRFEAASNNPTRGLLARIYNIASSSQTGAQILFTQDTTADWVIGQPAGADAFSIWSGRNPGNDGTEQLRLTNSGILLMGVNAPVVANAKIHVGSSNDSAIQITKIGVVAARLKTVSTALVFGVDSADGDTERVRITSGGNVGIGTTSPSGKLNVNVGANNYIFDLTNGSETAFALRTYNHGTASINSLAYTNGLYYNTTENASIKFYRGATVTGGWLTFTTNDGSERMRIAANGNVGIGTTSPGAPLHVYSSGSTGIILKTTANYATITADSGTSTGGGAFAAWQNGNQKAIFCVAGAWEGSTSADTGIAAETGHNIRFYTNGSGTEKMRLTTDGRVGIGTTSPAGKLDVYGEIYVDGVKAVDRISSTSGNYYQVFGSSSSGVGALHFRDIRQPAPEDFINGTMSFGFTSYALNNTESWADFIAMCSYTDSSGGNPNIFLVNRNASGAKISRQSWNSSTGFKDGTIYTLDYTSASDVSVKEDVQNITNALSIITQLRPVTFKWTDDYILNGMSKNNNENLVDPDTGIIIIPEEKTTNVGLIAQEVEAVLPTVVHQENVKLKDADRYLKNINYEKLVPHLIAAIQELKVEIDALKAQG